MAKSDRPYNVQWFTEKDINRIGLYPPGDHRNPNYRNAALVNVAGMIDVLKQDHGVIHQPIHLCRFTEEVRKHHNIEFELVPLRGFRRLNAMKEMLSHPDQYTAEVIDNLRKFPVVVWEGLTWQEAELFVLDQNSEQGLAPSEIVVAVYRLSGMGFGEMEISDQMYNLLGKLTKAGREKIRKAEAVKDDKERKKMIRDAVHPYLGNYLLRGEKIGPWVREQIILLHQSADNALPEGSVILATINTSAMNALSGAKTTDEKADAWDGPVVNVTLDDKDGVIIEGGGPETRKVLTNLITERRGGEPTEGKVKPLSAKAMKDKLDSFKSDTFKAGLRLATGEKSDDYIRLDEEAYRVEKVFDYLATVDGQFVLPEVNTALKALREEKNLEKVKEAFKPLLK